MTSKMTMETRYELRAMSGTVLLAADTLQAALIESRKRRTKQIPTKVFIVSTSTLETEVPLE